MDLVNNFSIQTLTSFLEEKFKDFEYSIYEEDITHTDKIPDNFINEFSKILEIFEVELKDENKLKTYAIKVSKDLSERSSKKRQFDLAKKLLQTDAGFFVFYDDNGNFRFSLVYKVYKKGKTDFSHYKRYTYFVEKGKPYRTFQKLAVEGDFSTLDNIIKSFSTQPLTKEFFTEIQNWYVWALKHAKFPGGILEENLIRLLTRLIFVWFLKEKKLIPDIIFDEKFLKGVVKDFKKSDYYYNVILQNLFFATLNRYPNERRFANHGSFVQNKNDFGVKSLYRYKDKILISEEEFLDIFKDVPFVNGGLFECLDEDKDYIDGFSRNDTKRAKIPDFLFFSDEREENLSHFYGEEKRAKVRGLINILKDYNFTADESTPIDIEVSLDPELLGHIFENLLALYNPETQTTARKATGSYYTPKEIVDFMVEQSLFEYFKTRTNIDKDKLKKIISYEEGQLDLSEEEKKQLIDAIDSLKIIDPAVGSGAFPMGILHKLVYILSKIDTDNNLWYELQYQKAIQEIEKILGKQDKEEREERLKELNDNFDEATKYPDYARKLYIIENSIYGVDIQNIAIQISKLRFFLSLIIDQKVDKNQYNFGIKPLPHLETKFVCANTLIGLEKQKQLSLSDSVLESLKEELKEVYKRFFRVKNREEKKKLEEKAKKKRQEIKDTLKKLGFPNETIEKIANFNIFSQTEKADWFDPEWMFGVEDGFDIVIGNPPYVRQEKIKTLKPALKNQRYNTFTSTADLYVYFYEKGYQLLKEKGVLSFITSNKWMRAKYGENLRKFLKENTSIIEIVDFGGYQVFAQTVDTCIVLFRKQKPEKDWTFKYCITPSDVENVIEYIKGNLQEMKQEKLSDNAWTLADKRVLALKEKIEKIGKPLKDWNVKIYRGVLTGFNEAFIIDTETRDRILANCKTEEERKRTEEIIKPVLRGRDIERWRYEWAGLYLILIPAGWTNRNCGGEDPEQFFKNSFPALYNHFMHFKTHKGKGKGLFDRDDQGDYWWELRPCDYYPEFEKEKIVWQEIVREPSFAFDNTGIYCEATSFLMTGKHLKYLLAVLNSKAGAFFFRQFYAGGGLGEEGYRYKKAFLEQLPIPPITPQNQPIVQQIENLVDRILSLTQDSNYDTDQQKQAQVKEIEKQIDQLVYKLYNLTEEEIKIIEGGENACAK